MIDDKEKNENQAYEELKKVADAADAKQARHRVDEYVAMIIALGAVLILWLFQFAGLY
ncbi:MAG TPA: hypothetical protein PKZ42_12170 [Syntrophales bacterium]|nr:hypothetical protein [Syntrophales bacterium]